MTTTATATNDLDTISEEIRLAESARLALHELSRQLKNALRERDGEVDALLLALVAGENALLVGPPGTAKSLLTRLLSNALGDPSYFEWLLSKFSTPEELFGPISLSGLEADEYRRVTTGKLPEARVAFLDEVFKANSAILNALLTILNERTFANPSPAKTPLEFVVGASNELPTDDALKALYDRFLVRRWTGYVSNRDNFLAIIGADEEPEVTARLSPAQLAALRAEARTVDVSGVISVIADIRDTLATEHGIEASDRRWRKCVKLVRAKAAIEGRDFAISDDLLVLSDALWDEPDDRAKIAGTVALKVDPDLEKALRLHDVAVSLYEKVDFADDSTSFTVQAANANKALAAAIDEIESLRQSVSVVEILRRVDAMKRHVDTEFKKRNRF